MMRFDAIGCWPVWASMIYARRMVVSDASHPEPDLADRADVEVLLRCFYGRMECNASLGRRPYLDRVCC